MRNLEIKLQLSEIPEHVSNIVPAAILAQTDTYYSVPNGRLKIREEEGQESYAIFYQRPNEKDATISTYHTYPVADVGKFLEVFGGVLHEEVVVRKIRKLHTVENARVHIDNVAGLGFFFEVEVVISNDREEQAAESLLKYVLSLFGVEHEKRVKCGYRELLLQKLQRETAIADLRESGQLCWIVNKNINDRVRANDCACCLYTELTDDGQHKRLQLDRSVCGDGKRYTMWRRFVGEHYGVHVSVLIFDQGMLLDLDGKYHSYDDVGVSDVYVNRSFLAPFMTTE